MLAHIIPVSTILYHGSARLYSIQCYVKRSLPLLQRYMSEVRGRIPLAVVTPFYNEWLAKVKEVLGRGIHTSYLPWTTEVIALKIIEEMYLHSLPSYRISSLLTNLPLEVKEWFMIAEQYDDVEAYMLHYPLSPSYFSVMKLPVQFFGDRETALLYGKGENQLYYYKPSSPLKLLDISNRKTVILLTTPSYPFSSFTPYDNATVIHHTSLSLRRYRAYNLMEHLLKFYNGDKERREEMRDKHYVDRGVAYNNHCWPRYQEVAEDKDWPAMNERERWHVLLAGQGYDEMLEEEIDKMRKERPLSFSWVARKYGSGSSNNVLTLVQRIMDDVGIEDIDVLVAEVMEGYLYSYNAKSINAEEREVGEWLASAVREGGNFLGAREEIDWIGLWVKGFDDCISTFLFEELGLNYSSYFTTEIASPKGDWVLSQWKLLFGFGEGERWSSYIQDTMLVYTLTSSSFFLEGGWCGWKCSLPAEVMVHKPWVKGKMHKINNIYNLDKCRYTGEETEGNFLKEYS